MKNFHINKENWLLYKKFSVDIERHWQKVKELLRNNLGDLVCDESIILKRDKKILKVPIKSLEEYCFSFDLELLSHLGQGLGNTKVGEVLGSASQNKAHLERGGILEPGILSGIEDYEIEIDVQDIEKILFEELKLPHLEEKEKKELQNTDYIFSNIDKLGSFKNINKKQTILENIKRNSLRGKETMSGFIPDDLRYYTWEQKEELSETAVVLSMLDISSSMGAFEKHFARSFFFWMVRFLKQYYPYIKIEFLVHHTEANVVQESEFFTRKESGGTRCSTVYELGLNLVSTKYDPSQYNIYAYHFSDGDNLPSDNSQAYKFLAELIEISNLVGYGEISNPYYKRTTLIEVYQPLLRKHNFTTADIKDGNDIYKALKKFFS